MASNITLAYLPEDRPQLNHLEVKGDMQASKEATTPPQTSKQLLAERIQFAALRWSVIVTGWNDGSTGPLLPRIQVVYGVRLHCLP
jgi:hypothetical protein